ncbi:MAG: hypothetical protein J5859_01305 [Clostridia bacterium]|nr:hypothetical protein [Clostridia bacterium]
MKLELDETELAERLHGLSAKPVFSNNLREWKEKEAGTGMIWQEKLLPCEIAVVIDSTGHYQNFLKGDAEGSLDHWWEENALSGHPVSRERVTHIYIGSQFCPHLLPDEETMRCLAEKALSSSLTPVFCLPPMQEHLLPRFESVFLSLSAFGEKAGIRPELVINDIGAALLLRDMEEKGRIPLKSLSLTAGILLTRRRKDPRSTAAQAGCPDTLFARYLAEQLGIERFSHETGSAAPVQGRENILHLPLYQTNTSGYCTLYAACRYHDRGRQAPVSGCPEYCRDHAFLYPEDHHMAGLGNTLFGCSMAELNDVQALNRLIRADITRLALRL